MRSLLHTYRTSLRIQNGRHEIILTISYSFQSKISHQHSILDRSKKKKRSFHDNFIETLTRISIVDQRVTRRHWTCCGHRRISYAVGIALSCLRAVSTEITHCIRRLRKIILLLPCIQLLLYRDGWFIRIFDIRHSGHFAGVKYWRFDNAIPR